MTFSPNADAGAANSNSASGCARFNGIGIEIGKLRHHEPIAVNVTVVGTNAVTTLTVASSVIGS